MAQSWDWQAIKGLSERAPFWSLGGRPGTREPRQSWAPGRRTPCRALSPGPPATPLSGPRCEPWCRLWWRRGQPGQVARGGRCRAQLGSSALRDLRAVCPPGSSAHRARCPHPSPDGHSPDVVCFSFSVFFFLHFQGLKILPSVASLLFLLTGGVRIPETRYSERTAGVRSISSAGREPREGHR